MAAPVGALAVFRMAKTAMATRPAATAAAPPRAGPLDPKKLSTVAMAIRRCST
jgi:hypothetical protein